MKEKITRRVFIASSLLAGTLFVLLPQNGKIDVEIEPFKVISLVQDILFPKSGNVPSASEFGAINYLITVSTHSSFLKDDLLLLYKGAKSLVKREPNFLTMSFRDKSKVIDSFSKTKIGENWLSLLLYYTIEALLSDPIYGGNRDKIGWRWLNHHAGKPRPKKPFGEIA